METKIEWADYTFNPWEGCEKVSPGCKNCYADVRDKRLHGGKHWGPNSERLEHAEAYWKQPMKWQREAQRDGKNKFVFCGSLCDILEPGWFQDVQRARVFSLVPQTPSLTWLFLTKRPENAGLFPLEWQTRWPKNVLPGFTAENDEWLERRWGSALSFASPRWFISAEPLLGPLENLPRVLASGMVTWVIAGGESGHNARPARPDWFRSIRDQCAAAGVPFLFKQCGEFSWIGRGHGGSDDVEPKPVRVGKKAAGRLLDGVVHHEFPEVRRG